MTALTVIDPGSASRSIVSLAVGHDVAASLIAAAAAGDAEACRHAINSLRRLPAPWISTIAAVALHALDPDDAELVVASVIRRAGWPLADELTPMHSARLWARDAGRGEKKAYALAAFERMHPEDQAAFLSYVGGSQAPG